MGTLGEPPVTASDGCFTGGEVKRNEQSSLWEVATIELADNSDRRIQN